MRFKHKPRPKHGDIRYKVFFAWLPIIIGLETRWLERVSVKQKYVNAHELRALPFTSHWLNIAFEQQPLPDFNIDKSKLSITVRTKNMQEKPHRDTKTIDYKPPECSGNIILAYYSNKLNNMVIGQAVGIPTLAHAEIAINKFKWNVRPEYLVDGEVVKIRQGQYCYRD